MNRLMVAGIGTGVGKTIASGILTLLLNGDYWKPIHCGQEENSDTSTLRTWLAATDHSIYAPAYSLSTPVSPHHAARLESIPIRPDHFILPKTQRPLIIEGVGGVQVPLTNKILTVDLFSSWNCKWIVVSRHYLGSINHTLLTIESLKQRCIPIMGLIFNGEPCSDTESVILENSQLPLLGRIFPESHFTIKTLKKYVKQWQPQFSKLHP